MFMRAIFVVFMLLLTAWPGGARACSGGRITLEERFNGIPTIFYARIVELERPAPVPPELIGRPVIQIPPRGRFELIEVLKGDPPLDKWMRDHPSSCGVGLKPSAYYIFFTYSDPAVSSWAAGSRRYEGPDDPELLLMLAKLRALSGR